MTRPFAHVAAVACAALLTLTTPAARADFRAGAAKIDITPVELPVFVNGGMLSRTSSEIKGRLAARAIVVDDGKTSMAIVIVDSCMMPRWLLDQAKSLASEATRIPTDHMLISATHAHSTPSTFGCLGTPSDEKYEKFLVPKLVEAIRAAHANMRPARIGAHVIDANEFTALRRWVRRPDKMLPDPFGNLTVRANMHPGPQSPDAIGPSGPEDPDLSVMSLQTREGQPIAMLANFANHYVGGPTIGPDYFGMFADRIEQQIGGEKTGYVAMMSQGTSGDVWLYDYFNPGPRKAPDIEAYTDGMVERAVKAYQAIKYESDATVAMAQSELPLRYRTPDKQRLEWAQKIVAEMGDRPAKTTTEVYANEAIQLDKLQSTRILVQAARIGDIAFTAMPNEVYALTGLKLKALSPVKTTINIELANGAEGYIPPPEQHVLGGYNTWAARSAGLEEHAEPKIVEAIAQLLENVSGKPRNVVRQANGPAAKAIIDAKPVAYWRLDEWEAPLARDQVAGHDGAYESGVVFYLEGPNADAFNRSNEINRAAHFAGGRMTADVRKLGSTYSVSMWIWNGMVTDARPVTGYCFSRGRDHASRAPGDHLGLGGTAANTTQGCLFFFNGDESNQVLFGKTPIGRWVWSHVVLVRDGRKVRVYLNGSTTPEIEGEADVTIPDSVTQLFVGGRCDHYSTFEGRIDEVAVFDRALSGEEAEKLFIASQVDK